MKQGHCFIPFFQVLDWENESHLNMEILGEDILGVDDMEIILDNLKPNQLETYFSSSANDNRL